MTNKTIVLTGATRGLGAVLTTELEGRGHTVLGCGRDAERIKELNGTRSGQRFWKLDVRDADAVASWAEGVCQKHGPPDILINNAALMHEPAPLWEIPEEEFSRIVDVNIKGVVNVIRAFVPAMVKRKQGVIANFSSGWGRSVSPNVAPYCATKWAIEGLSKAMAEELPKGMCCVPFNPGIIDTDMLRTAFGADAKDYPSPEDWAKSAADTMLKLGPELSGKSISVKGF